MRKRILSIFMALCLCCALLPTTALAADLPWESDSSWAALTDTTTNLTDGGKYYLTDNLTISTTITITGTVTLDLNGKTLTYKNDSTEGSVLKVGDSDNIGNLTLQDSSGGGIITGGTGTYGGGVCVYSNSSFTMTGGTIENCSATEGGGVYVYSNGSFTMSGTATIKDCTATGNGGAVYVGGTLKMGAAGSGTDIGILAGSDGKADDVYIATNAKIECIADTNNENCLPIAANVSLKDSSSKINGGKFTGTVTNNGNINGGSFNGTVNNNSNGTIQNGTFSGTIKNTGSITGGTFEQGSIINNDSGGKINGGTFNGTINNNSGGNIQNGTFNGTVNNNDGGNIQKGTFNGTVNNNDGSNIENSVDTENATLKYAVTFKANGGTPVPDTQYVKSGEKATEPTPPTKDDGSRFMYWYEKSLASPFNFTKATITAPITLTAAWNQLKTEIPYTTNIAKKEGADTPSTQTFNLEIYTDRNLKNKLSSPQCILEKGSDKLTFYWATKNSPVQILSPSVVYIKQVPETESDHWEYDETVYCAGYASDNNTFTIYKTTESNGSYTPDRSKTVDTMTFTHTYTYTYTTPVTPTPTPEPTPTPSTSSGGSSGSSSHSISASGAANGSVSISPKRASQGEPVTLTLKPDSGYLLESLTILDRNGKEIEVTDNGDGTYSFRMPYGDVKIKPIFVEEAPEEEPAEEPAEDPTETPTVEPADENNALLNFFVDVFPGEYYYDAVLWAAENGITGGVDALQFAPNQPCSRAQIMTFLWRAASCPEPETTTNPYNDISTDAYYYKAVLWAMEQGITSGTAPATFSPDDTCTRAQAASFLYRREQAEDGGFNGAWMFQLPFGDVPEWCYEAIAWCYMNEITGGTAETTFSPEDACTRGQIVSFLYRAQ